MKRLLLVLVLVVPCLGGFVPQASASSLPPLNQGFFTGQSGLYTGTVVLPRLVSLGGYSGSSNCYPEWDPCAVPKWIDTKSKLEAFILSDLHSSDAQKKTGAAFIIQTMLPNGESSRNRNPSSTQITDWENLIDNAQVNFNQMYTFNTNTSYAASINDDFFYPESDTQRSIVITAHDSSGHTITYGIKYKCGNPVLNGAFNPSVQFNNTAKSTVTVVTSSGSRTYNAGSTPVVFAGDRVTFNHYITSDTSDLGDDVTWQMYDTCSPASPAGNCADTSTHRSNATSVQHTYNNLRGTQQVYEPGYTEVFAIPSGVVVGTKYCAYVRYTPISNSDSGSRNSAQVCVKVGSQSIYDLQPIVNVQTPSGNNYADPGSDVTFTYTVDNASTITSANTACDAISDTYAPGTSGVPHTQQDSQRLGSTVSVPGWGCPRIFSTGSTPVGVEPYQIPANAAIGESICRTLEVNPYAAGQQWRSSAEACVTVEYQPYVSVTGGDASAGNAMSTAGGSCDVGQDADAGFASWNKDNVSNSGWGGAGTQYAAFALGYIQDFASAQGSSIEPTGLSFSNNIASYLDTSNGLFGGGFGTADADCVPDYFSSATDVHTTSTGFTIPGVVGDQTVVGNVINGTRQRVYIKGNVYINSNICFDNGGTCATSGNYASVSDIPSFYLIVSGNIYIAPWVTQIDGVYIAQPTGTNSDGIIYTCAPSAFSNQSITSSTLYNNCSTNNLTVNGSLTARQVWFERAKGTLSQNTPAETVNESPDTWLAIPPDQVTGSGSTGSKYDAITSLPPIL